MLKKINDFNFCDKINRSLKYQEDLDKIERLQRQYTANRFTMDWLKFEEVYQWLHLLGNSLTRVEMGAILDTRRIINDKPFSDYMDLIIYYDIVSKMKCSDSLEICQEIIKGFYQRMVLDPTDGVSIFQEKPLQFQADGVCERFNQSPKKVSDILDFCVELYKLEPFKKYTKTIVRITMNYLLLGNGYILCTQNEIDDFTEQFKQEAVNNLIFRYEFFIKARGRGRLHETVSEN